MRSIIPAALAASISCATAANAAAPSVAAIHKGQEGERLAALFKASDEASLRRNPLLALIRGDLRYADRIGDHGSDAYYAAERAAAEADLAALRKIDRSRLSAQDQIAYDVFEFDRRGAAKSNSGEILALTAVRPLDHFTGFHVAYAGLSSGRGAAPYKTVKDYEDGLKRHRDFVRLTDRWIERFRQGMASGVYETKLTIGKVIEQLDQQIGTKPEDSPYYAPALNLPGSFSEADKVRLRAAYLDAVKRQINPAYVRLRDFLQTDYLPVARSGVGLVHMKGGAKLYDHLIESMTTLPLKADDVHQIGLSEVSRIQAEMEKIRAELGFPNDPDGFAAHVRNNKALMSESVQALQQRYEAVGRKVDQRIAEQFSSLPTLKLVVRPYESYRQIGAPGASYERGALDGSRPGVFYFNGSNLAERRTTGVESLFLHEGSPGHHFQISLAQQNESLPNFMRFGGNIAFVEGWALYAETLGDELGLFTDPYQRYGHLAQEIFRARRLVVDTGIHAKGWTREEAIKIMGANLANDVDRYIAMPGQALGYKIGALTIQRLRKKAETALGGAFDPREFHAQVLMTGALPLKVLEAKIDRWIATKTKA